MIGILNKLRLASSIKQKLIALFLLVSIIPIITVSYMAFEYGSASTEERVLAQLTSIADLKENELERWLEEHKNIIQIYSEDVKLINLINSHEKGTADLPIIKQDVSILFHNIDHMHDYYTRFTVTNNSGAVIISTDPEYEGGVLNDNYITDPISTKEMYIKDIFKTGDDEFSMIFSAPVFSIDNETYEKTNEVIGVLIIEIDMAASLYPMIENWPGMGDTGETLLARREGNEVVFINKLRHLNEPPLSLRIPINSTDALPAIRSSGGEEGIMITEDYMGEEVLSAYRHIELPNWGFVAKIDEKEAFAGIDKLRNQIIALSIILIFLAVGMAIWISTGITRPIIYLEELTKKVAQGDFSEYPTVTSKDEIGSLTNSFVKMETDLARSRSELEDYSENLQQKVDERTNELVESKRRLLRAQEIAHVGDWELDVETSISIWSDELYRIYGFEPADEIELETVIAGIHPDDRDYVNDTLAGWIENGEGEPFEYRIVRHDGSMRYVYSPAEVVYDSTGKVVKIYGTVLDITERKHVEEELKQHRDHLEELVKERTDETEYSRQALISLVEDLGVMTDDLKNANERLQELDQLKSMFIASTSHELRTPLNSIIGFTSVLLEGWSGDLNPEQKEQLGIVLTSGKHLLNLINDVIDISKIEAGKLDIYTEQFNFGDVVNEAASLIETDVEEKGLTLTMDVPDITIDTDRRRLLQCIINLLSNAIKFTEKGSIVLKAKTINNIIDLSISDTGIGIKEEDLPKLFSAFVRLESPLTDTTTGTGLGLYLTGKLVHEALGGTVDATSKYGEGSTFTLHIPVTKGVES